MGDKAYNSLIMAPITKPEIKKAVVSSKRGSASGPDGIGISAIKAWEKDGKYSKLLKLFYLFLMTEMVPKCLKENRTVLLPKTVDMLDCKGNWRPITIGQILMRLFSSVIARRFSKAVELNPRLHKGIWVY